MGGREKGRWEGERKGGEREREREVRGREKGRWGDGERQGGGGGVGGVKRDRGAEGMERLREKGVVSHTPGNVEKVRRMGCAIKWR